MREVGKRSGPICWIQSKRHPFFPKLDMESQSDSQNVQDVKQMKIPTTTAEQRVSDNETAIADTEHN